MSEPIEYGRPWWEVMKEVSEENARLKADVERLSEIVQTAHADLFSENSRLKAENARLRASSFVTAVPVEEYEKLKAEVERLKEGNDCLDQMHDKEMERSAYLREEFNRSTAWGRGLESDLSHARVEISFLKAEVEWLRKAGDEMHRAIKVSDPILDWKIELWNAAKEGKQS